VSCSTVIETVLPRVAKLLGLTRPDKHSVNVLGALVIASTMLLFTAELQRSSG